MKKLLTILSGLVIAFWCMAARAGTFTMTVDEPAKVCVYDRQWGEMAVQQGEHQYSFEDGDFILICSMTETPLYQVTVDDKVAEMDYNYGGYYIDLEDGMVIDVQANYPDIKHTVTFDYADGLEGFWTSAAIDDVEVAGFNGKTLEAPLGKNVVIYGDTDKYPDVKVAVDGEERTYFFGDLKLFIEKDYSVSVYKNGSDTPSEDPRTVPFTLYVDNADAITASNGSKVFEDLVSEAPNNLEVTEEDPYLTITANEGFEIVKIYENEYSTKESPVYVSSDMTLYVTTKSLQQSADGSYTMTVDNPSKVRAYINGDWDRPVEIEQGTHEYSFNDGELLSIMPANSQMSLYQVLVNGEQIGDVYGSYDVVLEDGMNIEVKADFPDIKHTVTLEYAEGMEGFWTSAEIDGVESTTFDGKTFEAQYGSNVVLFGDTDKYPEAKVKVDGEEYPYFYGDLKLFIDKDYTVSVEGDGTVAPDASYTMTVDDPSKVCVYDSQWQEMAIQQGEHQYPFEEGDFILICSMTETPLYQVTVNGEVAEMDYNYGGYRIDLAGGMTIDVQANYPDIKHTVAFEYAKGLEGFWTSATIDGVEVAGFNGETLEAQMGANVILTGDIEKYPDVKISVDGEERTYFYGDLKLFMDKDYTVSVDGDVPVTPPAEQTRQFTLYVDNADAVTVSNGSMVFEGLLSEAPNQLEVPEEDPTLTITANEGFEITSIYDDENSTMTSPVDVISGMTLHVTTASKQETVEGTYTMTVDDPSKVCVYDSKWQEMTIKKGEGHYTFDEGDFILICSMTETPLYKVTVNGKVAEMDYNYGGYRVDLASGMKIDVLANYPDIKHTITFEYVDGLEGFWTSATIDDVEVAGFNGKTLEARLGSNVQINGDTEKYPNVKISVNGEERTYFYGYLKLFIEEDYTVSVSKGSSGTPVDDNSVPFTLYIDNADAVRVSNGSKVFGNLVSGAPNNLTVTEEDPYLTITAKNGYEIVKIYENEYYTKTSPVCITRDMILYVDTKSLQQSSGGKYTMTVDNPSKVLVYNSGNWESPMQIVQGTRDYSFNSGEYLMIMSTSSEITLYQVLVNGKPIGDTYGQYDVILENGMKVEIKADFPDKDCIVKFTYESGAKGFWKSAAADGVDVEGFNGSDITVKAGTNLSLVGDMIGYENVTVKVNGEAEYYFNGTLDLFVTEDKTINVRAQKAATVDFTLWIDDVKAVTVSRDGKYDYIEGLESGKANNISVTASEPYLYITPAIGYDIVSITDGNDASLESPIRVEDGMAIHVETAEKPLDKTAVFYLDHKFDDYFFNCGLNMDGGRKVLDIKEGYNIINFSDEFNQLFTNWVSPGVNNLYLNGVKQNGYFGSQENYLLDLKEGDIIKVYLESQPKEVQVSISANGKSDDLSGISVTRDIITSLKNWNGLKDRVFGGTLYTFAGSGFSVTLNGESVEVVDGVAKVVVENISNEIVVSALTSIDATGITLDKTEAEMVEGETLTLTATVAPEAATDKTVTWSTSDEEVATVADGVVTAFAPGVAVITAMTSNGLKAACEVTVVAKTIEATGITLDKTEAEMTEGETMTLTATVAPDAATDKTVTWSSSDEEVATVENGVVTAVAAGVATITATTSNGLEATCEVTVVAKTIEATGITLDKTEAEMTEGETMTLTATVAPEAATDKTVTWSTSDEEVATVADGVVTAVAPGVAVITATTSNGLEATCEVTVTAKTGDVTGITLDKTEVEMVEGETLTLTATVAPEAATDKTVTWSSSDEEVATVADGVVTAFAPGVAVITATTSNGLEATCEVTVVAKTIEATGITLDKTEAEMTGGETMTLTATIAPEEATDKTVTWSSSDEEVATVEDGVVTAVAAGVATITATTSNGLVATCEVTVIDLNVNVGYIEIGAGERTDVYTVNGVLLKKNADRDYISSLAKGVYIIKNKKYVVR